MKKRFVSILLALMLLSSLALCAFAEEASFVIDLSGRISDVDTLNAFAADIYESSGVAVSFAITDTLMGRRSSELAEYLYDGYVDADDGILLLDCLEADTYYIVYRGEGQKLSEYGGDLCKNYDMADTYDSGVRAYLSLAEEYLDSLGLACRDLVLLEDEDSGVSIDLQEENLNTLNRPDSSLNEGPLLILDGTQGGSIEPADNPLIPAQRRYDRVVDLAGVTDSQSLAEINAMADAVSERYGCDVAVAFVRHVDGYSAQSAADDFYDYNGYGYGDDDSGILLYVAVEDREYAMSTYMGGAYAFTDYGLMRLEDAIMPYLRESNWEKTAEVFIEECEELLAMADSGTVYDLPTENAGGYRPADDRGVDVGNLGIAAVLGLGTGFIPVAAMKRSMKSVRPVKGASDYVRRGSFELNYRNDIFIRRSVNRVPRQQPRNNNPGGPGGPGGMGRSGFSGGSTMRISSSGRSHGGRSGKF